MHAPSCRCTSACTYAASAAAGLLAMGLPMQHTAAEAAEAAPQEAAQHVIQHKGFNQVMLRQLSVVLTDSLPVYVLGGYEGGAHRRGRLLECLLTMRGDSRSCACRLLRANCSHIMLAVGTPHTSILRRRVGERSPDAHRCMHLLWRTSNLLRRIEHQCGAATRLSTNGPACCTALPAPDGPQAIKQCHKPIVEAASKTSSQQKMGTILLTCARRHHPSV